MCNVDEDSNTAPVARGTVFTKGKKCVKCDQQGIVVTRVHDSFCKDCFRVYVVHKFRSAIGKSKLIRDGDKVLVAFSGGASSATLLHLITDGLSLRAHKKLRFIPTLLHVDDFTILEQCEFDRCEIQKRVSEIMVQTGFDSFITSLEQGLNIDYDKSEDAKNVESRGLLYWEASADVTELQEPSVQDVTRLKGLLSNLSSTTCKEDFIRNFRNQLIVAFARKLGFNKVFTAECSSRLSVRILTDIAQGRGSQVSLDTGFSDLRNDNVMIIRPIRDLTSKEVAMYNNMFDVDSVFVPAMTTKAVAGASIERLTESFVTGLQADFPSTTSNIIRTSEKLSQSTQGDLVKCRFCQSSLDTNVGVASALNSILFSKKLSNSGRNCGQNADNDQSAPNSDGSQGTVPSANRDSPLDDDDISLQLCFGCRLTVQDFGGDPNSLPLIHKRHAQDRRMDTLRNQIADCLLLDEQS